MNLLESIKISLSLMARNKLRTALTVLGMLIGITSIMIVYSAGEGIRGLISGQIEAFGTNIIQTEIRVPSENRGFDDQMDSMNAVGNGTQITTLVHRDLEDVSKLDNVVHGYGAVLGQETISYLNERKRVLLFGVSAPYIDIDTSEIKEGYFFTEEDDRSLSQVVVLGHSLAEDLFLDENPIGKTVNLARSSYTIIGVLEEKGATFGLDFDNMAIMPVRTLQRKIMGIDHFLYMIHELKDVSLAENTAEDMRDIIRMNHSITDPDRDDFRVTTMKEMMETSQTITEGITILLLLIVTISLLVGGVGILNVMYVIVSERTPEIGLRKAVGARFRDIMLQFLLESVLITMIGAVLGIVLGVIASFFIYLGANYFGLEWDFVIPLRSFVVSLTFAFFFGVIFGIFPARKAARLNPVEALRKE